MSAQRKPSPDYESNTPLEEAIEVGKNLAAATASSLRANLDDQRRFLDLQKELGDYRIDSLTGVYLRKAFTTSADSLRSAVYRGNVEGFDTVLLAMFDLRKMHKINNRGGQQSGDEVLVKLAHKLSSFGKDENVKVIPARLGGDEFALAVIINSSEYPIEAMKQRIQEEMTAWADQETPHGIRVGDVVEASYEKHIVDVFAEADPKRPKTRLQKLGKFAVDARFSLQRRMSRRAA